MINDIKTVQDLIDLNNSTPEPEQPAEESAADKFYNEILDLEPSVGIEIAGRLLQALEEFHNQGVIMYIDENKADVAAQWAVDSAKLRIARQAISDISL